MPYPREAEHPSAFLPSIAEAGNHPERMVVCLRDHYSLEAYEASRRGWERQVEEAVRMLTNRQHDVYIDNLGMFVDLVEELYGEEEAWRRHPTFNFTAHAYDLALSKLTENMPTMRAMPRSADVKDAMLADLWSQVWGYIWDTSGMNLEFWKLYGWAIPTGRGVLKGFWDLSKGPIQDFRAPADIPLIGPDGTQYVRRFTDAPYIIGPDGEPQVNLLGMDGNGMPRFGPPHRQRLGDLTYMAINPLALLLPPGPEPHYRKPWYTYEHFLTPEQIWDRFKIMVEPDEITGSDDLMVRLSYASQYADRIGGWGTSLPDEKILQNLCRVREHWRREVVESDDPDLWYGRLTIATDTKVLSDGKNPYVVEGQQERAIIPFYIFDMPGFPFRHEGNGLFEFSNPINRAVNRLQGGMLDHAERLAHPQRIIAEGVFEEDTDWNKPAQTLTAKLGLLPQGRSAVEFEQMPDLPAGTEKVSAMLTDWLKMFTKTNAGGEGAPVTQDASGELQREVRYDADRPWGLPRRVHSYEFGRMGEDAIDIYSVCQTDDRLVSIFGDDQAPVFLDLRKDMWVGRVNVRPTLESQQLESRQDRINRVSQAFTLGLLDPTNPSAVAANEILGQPDLLRVTRPGGRAYERVQREHLEMYLMAPAPVLPEHDHAFDLLEHMKQQQTLQYRNAPDEVKLLFRAHIAAHQAFMAAMMAPPPGTAGSESGQSSGAGRPGERAPAPSAGQPGPTPGQ